MMWENEEKVAILEEILLSDEAAAVIRTKYRISTAVEGYGGRKAVESNRNNLILGDYLVKASIARVLSPITVKAPHGTARKNGNGGPALIYRAP